MYVQLRSAFVHGIEGRIVQVEADTAYGLPHFDIVGLPGTALKESKERVRAAIKNSGYTFPNKRVTVNLAPADLRKEGAYFDAVIALAVLLADEQLTPDKNAEDDIVDMLFIGELALDGGMRPCTGILPLVLAAKENGCSPVFLPADQFGENHGVEGIDIIPCRHLTDMIQAIQSRDFLQEASRKARQISISIRKERLAQREQAAAADGDEHTVHGGGERIDDIRGQEQVKRAFEVAATGFHHMLLAGPPGSGKTMLARCFSPLLTELSDEEMLEVAKIHSVYGLKEKYGDRSRVFRAPHHTVTATGMLGGGVPVKPGEVSVAHHGVLFLDEFPEFKRAVIEGLREPLEERTITITRHRQMFTFPAHFLLIVALNPCPCGFYGYETEQHSCVCTAVQIERYRSKLSGPLYDRVDLHIDVPAVRYEQLSAPNDDGVDHEVSKRYTTNEVRKRIQAGIRFRVERGGPSKPNGMLGAKEVYTHCTLTKQGEELLKMAFQQLDLSARGYHKILKIARTIADLNHSERIDDQAVAEAIQYRSLDRKV